MHWASGLLEKEKANLFLMQLIKNLGRDEITPASYLSKKIYQAYPHLWQE